MSITSIGKDKNYQDYLNRKIELSNQIALILVFFVALPFVLISYIYFRPLTLIPTVGILTCFLTIGFNYLKWHTLARIIVCLLPITLANLFGGYLAKTGQPVLPSISMLSLSFSFIIFLIIDIREKVFLTCMGMLMVAMIFSLDWFNNQFEIELETKIIETGYLSYVTMFLSILTGSLSITLVVLQNKDAEIKANNLLSKADQDHQKMIEKEEELKNNIVALETSKQKEKERQWASEGLTEAMSLIRDTEDSNKLYDQLISFIVKKVEAVQGSLFFINEDVLDDKYLELVASYAYDRKKFINKRIEIGEGLVGQVYIEKTHTLLKEIPADYVEITSGLGETNPNSIFILPLQINEVVYGILELASFEEIEAYKIEFLKSLGESIASTFSNNQVNVKTKVLLESTQKQAEILKAQEEEMRQSQEELNAVQEELNRQKNALVKENKELKDRLKEYES